MKERPILFNSEMVRAILEGRKTQTRRVIKNLHSKWNFTGFLKSLGMFGFAEIIESKKAEQTLKRCPYGQLGDRLWVRETWKIGDGMNVSGDPKKPTYKADWPDVEKIGWKPSIHMPRTHSRINLKITGIRVERVQDISYEDAIAEGIESNIDDGATYYGPVGKGHADPKRAFQWLWDSINKDRGFGWDKGPWVWVVEFKKGE